MLSVCPQEIERACNHVIGNTVVGKARRGGSRFSWWILVHAAPTVPMEGSLLVSPSCSPRGSNSLALEPEVKLCCARSAHVWLVLNVGG